MKTVTEHIREHALAQLGFSVQEHPALPPYEILQQTEWSSEFERYMRNRLIMGAFRYGRMIDKNKGYYDSISSAISRLQQYQETGNAEKLVDAANLCLVEFVVGNHPHKHFHALDDSEHAAKREDLPC